MIPYLKMSGRLPGIINGQVTVDELDKIAIVPGWSCLFDPAFQVSTGIRNRALSKSYLLPTTTALTPDQFVTVGSNTMFSMSTDSGKALVSSYAFNPSEWTAFFVIRKTDVSPTGTRDIIRPLVAGTAIGPRLTFRTTGQFSVYPSSTTTPRLTIAAGSFPSGTIFLLMVTFSTTNGLNVYVNNVSVGTNATDVSPLNEKYNAGEFVMFGNNSGTGEFLSGISGVLSIDLSKTENTAYRSLIFNNLKAKYNIT